MRVLVTILMATIFGLIIGIGIERVRERPMIARAPADTARSTSANGAIGANRHLPDETAPSMRSDAGSVGSFAGPPALPGVPPVVSGSVRASGPRTAPRQTRQQRATSAQIDAMVAHLRGYDGAFGDVDDGAVATDAIEATSSIPEIRLANARAVLNGMLEGFSAGMAPVSDQDAANEGSNDGRKTR